MSNYLLAFLFVFIFGSCVTKKKVIYFKSKPSNTTSDTSKPKTKFNDFKTLNLKYHLKPQDIIFIKVSGVDKTTDNIFNLSTGYSGGEYTEAGIFLNSYTVNDSGFIHIPVIGKVHLQDLTTEEAKAIITKSLLGYLKNPVVTVKLVNLAISIMGEVNKPGTYKFYQEKVSIIEALATAGDLTTYGNRKKIRLVRATEKEPIIYTVNITGQDLFTADYYYLQPQDIIYVEPISLKLFNANLSSVNALLLGASVLILILRVYANF